MGIVPRYPQCSDHPPPATTPPWPSPTLTPTSTARRSARPLALLSMRSSVSRFASICLTPKRWTSSQLMILGRSCEPWASGPPRRSSRICSQKLMKTELKDAFRLYDREGQGFITTETLRGLITELLAPLTEDEVEGILEELDEDGSGSMDFDEFCEMMMTKPE